MEKSTQQIWVNSACNYMFSRFLFVLLEDHVDRVKRICYLPPMRAAKVQASMRIRAVSPEPSLLAHTSSESRGTFRQKARSLAPLNGWACAVKIGHDGLMFYVCGSSGPAPLLFSLCFRLETGFHSPLFRNY